MPLGRLQAGSFRLSAVVTLRLGDQSQREGGAACKVLGVPKSFNTLKRTLEVEKLTSKVVRLSFRSRVGPLSSFRNLGMDTRIFASENTSVSYFICKPNASPDKTLSQAT